MALHPRILVKFRDSVSAANIKATMVCKIASRILEDVFRIAYLHISARFLGLIVDTTACCLYRQTEIEGRYVPPLGEDISRHRTVFFLW